MRFSQVWPMPKMNKLQSFAMLTTHPEIFTQVEIDPVGKMLGTRMVKYVSASGIHGLMRENGHGMIELLVVMTDTPGKGQFRQFIKELQQAYQTICIWHIDNQFLPDVLKRYGFNEERTIDEHGDALIGMRWDRKP